MRFAARHLGCKVSQADAALAGRGLGEAGHQEVAADEAEVCVISTCCITREAEAKSRQAARRALADGANRVFVTGCAANRAASEFDSIGAEVTALTGTAEEVAAEVVRQAGTAGNGAGADGRCDTAAAVAALRSGAASAPARPPARVRGFVKVQDGCDLGCSFCIVPAVRGAARSRPAAEILAEVGERARAGQREVVVTGISVGGYHDGDRGLDLAGLLRAVAGAEGVRRVRLSSIEVMHLGTALVETLGGGPPICPHLHVPLQSGDDRLLRAMGRRYDAAAYVEAIERVRRRVTGLNVTTDVIVGFPGEDTAAFANTLAVVRAAGITKVHVFPYSLRPGTTAEPLGDPVPTEEKRRRGREVRDLAEAQAGRRRRAKIGTVEEVLVDKADASGASGYAPDYTRVHLPAGSVQPGEIAAARIAGLCPGGVRGEPAGASRCTLSP